MMIARYSRVFIRSVPNYIRRLAFLELIINSIALSGAHDDSEKDRKDQHTTLLGS
jgi:hypothetical protein